jgi:hypothetical protein
MKMITLAPQFVLTPGLTENEIIDRASKPPGRTTGEYIVVYVLAASALVTIITALQQP